VFSSGGGAVLVTLTLRHHARQPLRASWDALRYAWSRVTSGRRYVAETSTFGITGWCAVVEVTHGEAGFHPHLHVLVFTDVPISAEMAEQLGMRWWPRWERALSRFGFSAVMDRGGLDARAVSPDEPGALGTYLSKIAHEVTGGHSKRGRNGNRSMFEVFADGLATGLADDLEAWWQYEQASLGRRQLTWAKGTRERYGLEHERTDEEIAAEELGGDDLIALPVETWRQVRWVAEQLLSTTEKGGLEAACQWLNARGLAWSWAKARPRRARPDTPE
jgi:hypothetical protein